MNGLEILASLSAILTAIVAAGAAARFWLDAHSKRLAVKDYLRKAKAEAKDEEKGQRSILHLMARIGLTESEVLHAAFKSKNIKPVVSSDEKGRADAILLEYIDLKSN